MSKERLTSLVARTEDAALVGPNDSLIAQVSILRAGFEALYRTMGEHFPPSAGIWTILDNIRSQIEILEQRLDEELGHTRTRSA